MAAGISVREESMAAFRQSLPLELLQQPLAFLLLLVPLLEFLRLLLLALLQGPICRCHLVECGPTVLMEQGSPITHNLRPFLPLLRNNWHLV